MPNTQEKGLIKVLGAFWHVEKKESRFGFEFKTISGRRRKKVLRLPEIEEFSVFRRTMVEAGFSFSGLRAADLHGALMRQCRRAAEDRKSERRLTSELGWHEGAFVLCSFWMIDNLTLQGRLQEAADRYDRMCARTNRLGLLPEEIDPGTGRFLGNFPQAFSHIGLITSGVNIGSAMASKDQVISGARS